MLNGLDLFSGIGGLTLALSPWVQPVAYCEIERYAQGVLLSRMADGQIPIAPIWDDVRTLSPKGLRGNVDIIYGGFPCQDISVAGRGVGLAGKRSGLFSEIMRLVDELQPKIIFLENVPAITTRGLDKVTAEITKRGYDSRWQTLSASEVGAPHKRNRWWLLAYSRRISEGADEILQSKMQKSIGKDVTKLCSTISNANSELVRKQSRWSNRQSRENQTELEYSSWWSVESDVGRVVNGLPFRMDRLKGLGNAVVPAQARKAFEILMGLNNKKATDEK